MASPFPEHDQALDELRACLMTADVAGIIAAPTSYQRLLELIVQTAAHVLSAKSASLFLVDERTSELVFEVAIGPKADSAKKFRVPLGHGIAGTVALTGQPMAVAQAEMDHLHAADLAQAIDYLPQSILCVPLYYSDQIIGVLELLDKQGMPSFEPRDMEILRLFANQAAIAIEQSRSYQSLGTFFNAMVQATNGGQPITLPERAANMLLHMDSEDSTLAKSSELAWMIQEIVQFGDLEQQACKSILSNFVAYLRARTPDGAPHLSPQRVNG